ncbi:MAG: hypothetical protein K2N06_01370 [Oscillospiraceae bacterium]|nr:hypothetical protein [Oscillospiraceae bacterium]
MAATYFHKLHCQFPQAIAGAIAIRNLFLGYESNFYSLIHQINCVTSNKLLVLGFTSLLELTVKPIHGNRKNFKRRTKIFLTYSPFLKMKEYFISAQNTTPN